MSRLLMLSVTSFLVPAPPAPQPAERLVGQWSVEFTNGVRQTCEVDKDGKASVAELLRSSNGKTVVQGGSIVITFEDDRAERWTPVGNRFIVEHWFPASQLPTGTAVLGIAERVK